MTDRERYTGSAAELSTPLSVLYSVVEDAKRYADYLEGDAQGIYDQELADFLAELRNETDRRAECAEVLCSPSGWPTAEFVSVLAGLRRTPNTRGPENTPS